MKLDFLFLSTLLLNIAAASQHKHEKREAAVTVVHTAIDVVNIDQVVTVYEDGATAGVQDVTQYTSLSNGITTLNPVTSSSTAAASSSSSASIAIQNKKATGSASYSSTSAVGTASASTAASTGSSSSNNIASGSGSAGTLGIAYTPYANNGQCKSSDEVKSDISKLSGYNIIRMYNVDCNGVQNVLSAMGSNQKLFAGLYTLSTVSDEVSSLNQQIKAAGKDWSVVDTVSVGNELVNSNAATTSQIQAAITAAKNALNALGYTGPVVSVDTFTAVINHPELCKYSDYVAVNCHPYFDGGIIAKKSGDFIVQQIKKIQSVCGSNKEVVITETGWPHSGNSNGKAVPSVENQEAALESIKSKVGDKVFLFSVYNDKWKSPGYYDVEQNWGIYGDSPN